MRNEWDGSRAALALTATLVIALHATTSFAMPLPRCAAIANHAAIAAVDRTRPLGQSSLFGDPYVIAPGIERVVVDVFGAERLSYEVDVTLDASCNVLRASPRLESGRNLLR